MIARRKRGRLRWAAVAVLAIVAAVAAVIVNNANKTKAAEVRYSSAESARTTVVVSVSGSGSMEVIRETSVEPAVSGDVADLKVSLGQKVAKGAALYTIENDTLDDAVASALAAYRKAQQSVTQAELSLLQARRDRASLDETPTAGKAEPTDLDYDIADAKVDSAELGVTSAKAERASALGAYEESKDALADRTVVAPHGGTVTSLDLEEGDAVGGSSGDSASGGAAGAATTGGSTTSASGGGVVISDLESMVARVQLNEVDLASVKAGQKATLSFDAVDGLEITGKVSAVAITGTNNNGVVTYDVEIAPDLTDERVRPGMSVSADIVTEVRKDVIAVPNAAVKSDDSGSYVQVLADGTPQRIAVTTGASNDTYTEVVEGLEAGLQVVTSQISASDSGGAAGTSMFGGMGGGEMRRATGGMGGPPAGR